MMSLLYLIHASLPLQCWAAAPADRPTADQLVKAVAALIAAREGQVLHSR
jgi:hypothetical protein